MTVDVNAIAQSFTLTGVADEASVLGGVALPLQLVSDLPIGDSVITEVISGAVDLDLLFRHVKLADITGNTAIGPWPAQAVAGTVVQPATGTTPNINVIVNDGLATAPGAGEVEGWAATISGTIPLGFRQVQDAVQVDYQWTFTDGMRELPASDYSIVSGSPTAVALSAAFRPEFEAWTAGLDDVEGLAGKRRVCIQAKVRVRLAVSGADSGWVSVPSEPLCVNVRPLPLPEVAVLFRDKQLKGNAAFVTVPKDSPFATAGEVFSAVNKLNVALAKLKQVASVVSWGAGLNGLVGAVEQLATNVPTIENVGFKQRDSHDDLGKYNFIHRSNMWDTDIEDRASSALALTVTRKISFYQHDGQGGKRLSIDARPDLDTMQLGGALVEDLHAASPVSTPAGAVDTNGSPSGGWGDCISSYRWED